ncbi:hypothetical protein CR513_45454, partial [Mucuna pruriens]
MSARSVVSDCPPMSSARADEWSFGSQRSPLLFLVRDNPVKIPFTAFEWSILHALNVAPTQLHPNSWTFVRAFKLLCEDLGRVPSLGVFFWFFSLRKVTKVGWTSLSSRPWRKLLKPFLESFKVFKDKYFKVGRGATGPNVLADKSGSPFFPLYWTSQPAVSVMIVCKDLEKWEDEFITKLENLPLLSCADLIKGIGFSVQYLKNMKKRTSQQVDEGTSAPSVPLSVADTLVSPAPLEGFDQSPPVVILDSPRNSSFLEEVDPNLGDERLVVGGEESLECPRKRLNLDKNLAFRTPTGRASLEVGPNMDFEAIICGRPSSPYLWTCSEPVGRIADRNLLTFIDGPLVQQLGVAGTLSALQRFAGCSLMLDRAAETKFGLLDDRVKSLIVQLDQVDTDKHKWENVCSEADLKLENFKKTTTDLREELRQAVDHNRD